MSFRFEYDVICDSEDEIHEEECYRDDCDCDSITKGITLVFSAHCGSIRVFKYSTQIYVNKYDKLNLKKFVEVLKNPEQIEEIVENAKSKYDQIYANRDRTDLTKNRRLFFSEKSQALLLNFHSSRDASNTISFNRNDQDITFHSQDIQQCGNFCSCHACENYGRYESSQSVQVPFTQETQDTVINAFEEVLGIIE